ncbi:YegP family protein [Leuconostoc pseudomesenteroides]|uniref:DUF1508 domain-containing protein n=1 Tax=Leuconostoc pseudomesenteroides TaxID=33968 RepID=UPI00403E1278
MFFSLRKSIDGQFYFLIKANNDEVVATSETYKRKESALHTINAIKNGIDGETDVIDVTDI